MFREDPARTAVQVQAVARDVSLVDPVEKVDAGIEDDLSHPRQPQPHVPILPRLREGGVETPETTNHIGAHQRRIDGAALEQVFEGPAAGLLHAVREVNLPLAHVARVAMKRITVDEYGFRIAIQSGHLPGKSIRSEVVVRIHEHDVFAAGERQAVIPGDGGRSVRLPDVAEAWVSCDERRNHFIRIVRRTVVDHNALQVGEGLPGHALERLADQIRPVVGRYHYADPWHTPARFRSNVRSAPSPALALPLGALPIIVPAAVWTLAG